MLDTNTVFLHVAYLENELKEHVGDFIASSSVGRLEELEETVVSQTSRIQELEQQVQAAIDDLGSARQLAEERTVEVARLTVQQQAPPAIDSATEVAELRRKLEKAHAV